jgi:hypothetical protein
LNYIETNSFFSPEWIGIVVALLLGLAGIFQDWIRSIFRKPKLDVSMRLAPPDSHKTSMRDIKTGIKISDTYYLRFKVANQGNYRAEDTEAVIVSVKKKNELGEFIEDENFLPLNLKWSHYGYSTAPKIQPHLFKYLDFGHVQKSSDYNGEFLPYFGIKSTATVFIELEVDTRPNTGSHILLPGEYIITIVFAGNNVSPKEIAYRLFFKDEWSDNEEIMLSEIIKITEEVVTGL